MNVVAVSARSFAVGTWLATGVRPVACPPVTEDSFPVARLRAEVAYICLHGGDGDPYLRGDDGVPVLSAGALTAAVGLPGTLVYMAGCWGAPQWSDAFLAAGARAVVADRNVAWAGKFWPSGSHALGRAWLRELRRGEAAGPALDAAMVGYAGRRERDVEMLASVALFGDPMARVGE